MLGTAEGVYRFTVARPKGGPLTVEAKPLAPHAEVTRMRVEGTDAARRGHRRRRAPSRPSCSRAAAATRWRSSAAAQLADGRFSASLDLGDLALPGKQADVWNLRLVAGRRSYRLGTHLDGITNRGEATEYPAAASASAACGPTTRSRTTSRCARSIGGGEPSSRRSTRSPSRGWRAACSARRPCSCTGSRCGSPGCAAAAARRTAATCASSLLHAWGMGGTVRAALSLAESLAESGRSVEIVSVVRRTGKPFFPFPDGRQGHRGRRPAQGRRAAREAAEPARAPRGLRLSVVQPAHGPACSCGASARCRAASWSARARASTCSPPRSRPRAPSPSPRST